MVSFAIFDTLSGGVEFKVWPVIGGGLAELRFVRSVGGQNDDRFRSGWCRD